MIQNHVAPYVPCELVGTPLYYGAWDMENLFFWLLQGHQPFESIPPLMQNASELLIERFFKEGSNPKSLFEGLYK